MSTGTRIASFALALGAVFLAAFALGSAFEPVDTEAGGHDGTAGAHGEAGGGHGEASAAHGKEAGARAGGSHAGGYALDLDRPELEPGEPAALRFRVEDAGGQPVTEFDELHERRMHLIVVRRDGAGFQHLHPELGADGTWAVPLRVATAGTYRAFADFSVDGEQYTLSADLIAGDGEFAPRPFPAPAAFDTASGYDVRLDANAPGGEAPRAGAESRLGFAVFRDGEEVSDLQPYLGAKGHLVALREGDLAYLHVHPEEGEHAHGGHAATPHPNEIAFATAFPSPGRYRLYLQFRHEGAVRTAEFTVEVPR